MTYADEGEELVRADDLSRGILDFAARLRNHMGYIERALDSAEEYGRGLHGKDVRLDMFREGMDFLTRAEAGEDHFVMANEDALNLRRADDLPLNNHYG
jgi:hypothetical protein